MALPEIVFVPIASIDTTECRIHALRCLPAAAARPDATWDATGLRAALRAVSILPFDLDFVFTARRDAQGTIAVVRDLAEPPMPHAIRLSRVVLEVSAACDLPTDVAASLEVLRGRCMRLSLAADPDVCSHAALLRLRPDYLALPEPFVNGIGDDPDRQMVLESVVQLAWKLGAQVIAEGVRTVDEVKTLRCAGVSLATGVFFSGPLLLADLEEWQLRSAALPGLPSGRS